MQMALVLRFCYRCFIYSFMCCIFVVGQSLYHNEQHSGTSQQQSEEKPQRKVRHGKQPPEIKFVSSHPSSVSKSVSSSFLLVTETKRTKTSYTSLVDSNRQSQPDNTNINQPDNTNINHIETGLNFHQKRYTTDPENKIYAYTKRQSSDKTPSISPKNADERNTLNNQRKIPKVAQKVDSSGNRFRNENTETIFPSKEEYLKRYYRVNRKEKWGNNLRKEEKRQDDVLSLASTNRKTRSAPQDEKENNLSGENVLIGDRDNDFLKESKRRPNLYILDKSDDAVNYTENEDEDGEDEDGEDADGDNMNADYQVKKYTGGRVKRRVTRPRHKWTYEDDDRNVNYGEFDYLERNKERHGGGRNRSRMGKGRRSQLNGHDRGTPETEMTGYDDTGYHRSRSPRRSYQRSANKGSDGDGNGERNREEGGGGGGGGEGDGDGGTRDRREWHRGNRHSDLDISERDYSDQEEGPGEERPDPASVSPSPSSSHRSYGRYADDSDKSKISKSSTQKTCHICTMKKMDREMRLRTLKAQIMKQIGLNDLPNITKNNRILSRVPALKHIIENMTMQRDEPSWKDSLDDQSTDINEQMIITAEKPNHLIGHFGHNMSGLCYFNVSGRLETSVIKKASLWLYLRPNSKIRRSTVEVLIWDAGDRAVHSEPLKILKVEIGRFGEWTHFKATSIVKQWVKNTRLNYGLNITAIDSHGNNRIWTPNIPNHVEEYPVMDIKFSPRRHNRHRRTVGQTCTDEEHTGRCCLYPLVVDFLEMKWNWVIHPHYFEANYCSGNCSLEFIDDTQPYTYIGFKSASTIDGVRCCTSTREGKLQILYHTTSNKIIHTYLEDIVVKECGCR